MLAKSRNVGDSRSRRMGLLPRRASVEGGDRRIPTDQKGLSQGILDVFCACPMVRLVRLAIVAMMMIMKLSTPADTANGHFTT